MRIAYIWASCVWQISVLGGSAALTYLSGNGWWVTGGIGLMFLASWGLSDRLDGWRKDATHDNEEAPE